MSKLAVFDLNGTLIGSTRADGFVFSLDHWFPMPGCTHVLRAMVERGWMLAVATNQSAHHHEEFMVNRTAMKALMEDIEEYLCEAAGAPIHFEVSWDAPGVGGSSRKPAPDLILRAMSACGGWPEHLAVIGDKRSDMVAGYAAGASVLVLVGQSHSERLSGFAVPAFHVCDLRGVLDLLPTFRLLHL